MSIDAAEATRRVLLRGYYGFGNFGDDLLLLTAYRMLREAHPHATVHVRCLAAGGGTYLPNLLGEDVPITSSLEPIDYDLVVDGGGGVFFDFEEGPRALTLVNTVARAVPTRWLREARRAYRVLRGTHGADSARRVGVGIGVGTFTKSSRKFLRARSSLGEYNHLLVRDDESRENARSIVGDLSVSVSADLVFARRFWCPAELRRASSLTTGRRVGFVLRRWSHDGSAHLGPMASAIDALRHRGVEVTVFLLEGSDEDVVRSKLPSVPYVVWRPSDARGSQDELSTFLRRLASVDLIVTTRAHGAIAGACLGVPAICVAIEPKLQIVAEMLKRSATALDVTEIATTLARVVEERLGRVSSLREAVSTDVEENERQAEAIVPFLQRA